MSSEDPWEVLSFLVATLRPKYKGNDHNLYVNFVLTITDAYFSILLSVITYILPVLCIDTYIGTFHNPIKPCHYGHFVDIGHNGLTHYALRYC